MGAGASARHHADRARLEAAEYERLAHAAREEARRYALAGRIEASVASRLRALEQLGWKVLTDRRWAGSKRANLDCLLVGPGGVVVVDVKAWRSLEVRDGRVFCDGECRDSEIEKLLSLTARVEESVSLLGLTPGTLRPALVFAGRRLSTRVPGVDILGELDVAAWITRLGHRLSREQVDTIAAVLAEDFPAYDAPAPRRVRVAKARVVMPVRRAPQPETLFDVDELTRALVDKALAAPIESWMTFLHPDQLKLVRTGWSGPARVRGPAGTGKTVVALHRACYLAERSPRKVLFVTFVKTLPLVLGALCERMSPTARANIHFSGVHRLALDIIEAADVRVRIDGAKVRTAFEGAWASVGRLSALTRLDERRSYWQEEIDYVIKGRGLVDFDEYAELSRVGRRTPMRPEHRAAMWELYREYENRLRRLGVHDFTDALIMARDLVREGHVELDYGSVVVDEAQDLNLVGIELLHAIAGDGPDGLLVVGDGQQAVYPGGFTLAEAGISVSGRAAVLRYNYRNAAEILEVAEQVVAADAYDDLDGESAPGRRDVDVQRRGGRALSVYAPDRNSLDTALVRQIRQTVDRLGTSLGDMAVLVATRRDIDHYAWVLRRAGLPFVDLKDYDGHTSERIKLGTFKRAKGLEFAFVLLPGLRQGPPAQWPGESTESHRERAERMRRELYVGMTRARDGLWLGYLAEGSTARMTPAGRRETMAAFEDARSDS